MPCILTGCFDKFHPVKKAASWVKILCCGLHWCVNQVALISSLAAARPLCRARHDSYNGCATTMQRPYNEYTASTQRLCNGYTTTVQRLCNDCATAMQRVRHKHTLRYVKITGAGTCKSTLLGSLIWRFSIARNVDECDGNFKRLREEIRLLCSARIVSKQMA